MGFIKKRYEEVYDISNFDKQIVEWRKHKQKILTILDKIVGKTPLDEIVILAHVLNVLRDNKFEVNKKEIRKAFRKFYKKEKHGGELSYLAYLYRL